MRQREADQRHRRLDVDREQTIERGLVTLGTGGAVGGRLELVGAGDPVVVGDAYTTGPAVGWYQHALHTGTVVRPQGGWASVGRDVLVFYTTLGTVGTQSGDTAPAAGSFGVMVRAGE